MLKTGVPFEINTGAISRGCRQKPYPSEEILAYLAEHGGSAVLSGDAHSAKALCFGYDESFRLAARLGLPLKYPEKLGF